MVITKNYLFNENFKILSMNKIYNEKYECFTYLLVWLCSTTVSILLKWFVNRDGSTNIFT